MLFLLFYTANAQESKLIASCCSGENVTNEGRCSGTASCSACSSCRYCGHCAKGGGTCGVCSPSSTAAKTTSYSYTSTSSFTYGDKLVVVSENLNMRDGAGIKYEIVEKLKLGDALTYLSRSGEWIEVRAVDSGKKGYVHSKYVR